MEMEVQVSALKIYTTNTQYYSRQKHACSIRSISFTA